MYILQKIHILSTYLALGFDATCPSMLWPAYDSDDTGMHRKRRAWRNIDPFGT